MRSVSGLLLVAAALGAISLTVAAPPATGAAAPSPQTVRWLALGDSFSSGEGIPGAAAGNPDLQGKQNCQRANGDDTDAKAYAVVAVDELQQSNDLAFERPFFVACTGAITDDASTQISEMRSQVPAELALWDVVSMSFGGNNVLFADLIIDCLDAKDPWGLVVYEGCSVSEERLRARVDMLVGRTPGISGEFAGEVTLPQLYDQVAGIVQPGGHVVVTGYPQLLEEPERWASWIRRRSLACQGILKDDIRMLRGVTGYLNEQIGAAVLEANERWQATGITFHFVDLASSVYETSENNADRHGLCASDQWINGLTAGVTSGDFRKERSFHPTQAGHQATGRHLADQIRDNFAFDTPPPSTIPDEILSAANALARVEVPSLCLHPAGVAVDGAIPSSDPLGTGGYWGMNLDGAVAGQLDDDPPLEYAVTVDCSAGGVSWPSYVLLYDDDVSLVGHFNLGDLFPDDGVWRGGIGGLAFDPWLSGDVGFEESGIGPWWESYFVLESFADYPCVTVGDLVTFDPYGIDVISGEICSQGGRDIVTSEPDPVSILTDYLLAAGARDYSAAWSMLTAGYQNKYGSYDKFASFWNGIDVVGINSTTVVTNGSTATITADVWFKRTDGTTSSEIVEVDITGNQISDYRFIRSY